MTLAKFGQTIPLKGLFQPACLARDITYFDFVITIFMAHGNNKEMTRAKHAG